MAESSQRRGRRLVHSAWPALVVPLVALCLVLPLLLHGPSCGHDFGFHMQSWMDAAEQMRHGTPLPHWAYSPAFNAGEPRFTFYPPLSWVTGSLLLLLLPANLVPAAFTFVSLTLAGWGMWALARRFAGPSGAYLAATAYLVNPYMLFTAFERTAFAELLAAAWMPWLLRAALAGRLRILPIAVPLALLWLTNAPAAVMGTYALVLIIGLRLLQTWRSKRRQPDAPSLTARPFWQPAFAGAAGLTLGLGLSGFYLVPAAWERRYVQIALAIIPNMRVEDNFLFGHTGNGPHDQVLATASVVSLWLLGLTGVALMGGFLRRPWVGAPRLRVPASILMWLAVCIAVLLFHVSLPVWHALPELAFLQFPWRWLAVLGCVFGAGMALLLRDVRVPAVAAVAGSLALAAAAGAAAMTPFRQGCEAHELPHDRVALFAAHHGVGGTDEYTPTTADNDQLRWDNPAWWTAADANAPAPNTIPNPAATIENYDTPPPLDQTISGRAPTRLHISASAPEDLILNLRDYPAWDVTVNGTEPKHLQRDDGLIAVPLPPGSHEIAVRWRRLPDVWLGDGLTLSALCLAGWLGRRSRRIDTQK